MSWIFITLPNVSLLKLTVFLTTWVTVLNVTGNAMPN